MQVLTITKEERDAIKAMISNQRQKFDELAAEPFASLLSKTAKANHYLDKEGKLYKSRKILESLEHKLLAARA